MRPDKCQVISSAMFICIASMATGAFVGFIAGGMIDSESTDVIHGDFRGPKIGAGAGAAVALVLALCAFAGAALYARQTNRSRDRFFSEANPLLVNPADTQQPTAVDIEQPTVRAGALTP
jgi:hypothetical protein